MEPQNHLPDRRGGGAQDAGAERDGELLQTDLREKHGHVGQEGDRPRIQRVTHEGGLKGAVHEGEGGHEGGHHEHR